MKTMVFILVGVMVSGLYWSCEPESDHIGNDPVTVIPRSNGNEHINTPIAFEWAMVVKSIDSFVGGESNEVFKDVILGITLPSGLSTTNTTYFKMYPAGDKMELLLGQVDWTLWEAHGYYPFTWEFKYLMCPYFRDRRLC